jgi:hypothetical protein
MDDRMIRVTGLLLAGLLPAFGLAPAASAQGGIEVELAARTDTGGAAPSCLLAVRLRNGGDRRITVFMADVEAKDAASGASLRLNQPQIPFSGVEPGATREWTTAAVAGARCEQVRLQVTRVTCSPRCGDAIAWRSAGLGGFQAPER